MIHATRHIQRLSLIAVLCLFACTVKVQADSAAWSMNPIDDRWNNPRNWIPATVPDGRDDSATFAASALTAIRLANKRQGEDGGTTVSTLTFTSDAGTYTLTAAAVIGKLAYLNIEGTGIVNNSSLTQNIVAGGSRNADGASIYFLNSSSAGENVVIADQGGEFDYGGATLFWNTSTAGRAEIINQGNAASGSVYGGICNLADYSSADSATFINNAGIVSGAAAGHTLIQTFPPGGNLGTSTFIANAAKVPGAEGGWVEMDVGTCAGTRFIANGATLAGCQGGQVYAYGAENDTRLGVASYTAHGGNGDSAEGGLIDIFHLPLETQTVVTALGGSNGGFGGLLQMEDTDDMPVPQFRLYGNGTMDLSNVTKNLAIGSLAGDGLVHLAGHNLGIGGNNLDTVFSGVISGQGNLTKEGTGTLSLNGINTYGGNTTVRAGTLGGKGTVKGKLIVASSASLAPAAGSNRPVTFTSKKDLTFQSGSTYECLIASKGSNAKSDQIRAKGITIESGGQLNLTTQLQGQLPTGASFIILNNTASAAISGTFSNLPDGASITINGATLQASYEGGDGNDLTLTVQ